MLDRVTKLLTAMPVESHRSFVGGDAFAGSRNGAGKSQKESLKLTSQAAFHQDKLYHTPLPRILYCPQGPLLPEKPL